MLRVGQLLIAAAPGEFTTMAGRSNPGVDLLRGQRLFETFPLQASSRDSGRRVEGGVHSGGGRVGKLVHALHHHLGGVPDPEVYHSFCFSRRIFPVLCILSVVKGIFNNQL